MSSRKTDTACSRRIGWRSLVVPLAAAVASTLLASEARAACPQLLQNSEFNNGDSFSWEVGDSPPEVVLTVRVSDDQYKTLDVSAGNTSAFTNPTGSLSQPVAIQYGERYRVSFYMYSGGRTTCHVSIGSATSPATTYGLNDSFVLSDAVSNATQQFTFVANADDPDAVFTISFPLDAYYTFYRFDSLFIEDISSPQCNGGVGGQGGGAGTVGTGGGRGTGGTIGAAGTTGNGGSSATGGVMTAGGSIGTGGKTATGGASGIGGAPTTGGSIGAGGQGGAGGATGAGGGSGTGGATATGGTAGAGGYVGTDAAAGGIGGATGTSGDGIGGAVGGGGAEIPDAGAVPVSDVGVGGSTGHGGSGLACVPGTQISCACPGSTAAPHGVQVCDSQGASYGACVGCPDAGIIAPASRAGGGCSCSFDSLDRPTLWWALLFLPLARRRRGFRLGKSRGDPPVRYGDPT